MHPEPPLPAAKPDDNGRPWYKELNRYHWFVLAVCALGWLFDCLDQQLFILAQAGDDSPPPGLARQHAG